MFCGYWNIFTKHNNHIDFLDLGFVCFLFENVVVANEVEYICQKCHEEPSSSKNVGGSKFIHD